MTLTGREDVEAWQQSTELCVSCPDCAFTFDSMHTDQGGGYSCPVCAEIRLEARLAEVESEAHRVLDRDAETLENRVPIPAVKRCWERASVPMPPSDPTDPDDPQTNLDTLAAIATAKWLASEDEAAEVACLQAHFAALNSENTDLNRENTKLLEKWSEAKARDPQQVEYLTSLAKAEARLAEVERALPGVEHLDIAVKALRQMGFFDSASAMLGLRNEISP